jgi:hypothetical protein
MSTYVDAADTRLWLDGDAFRAPAGTALPVDPFASSLAGWAAFGLIKAGFTVTTAQNITNLDGWNNTSGAPVRVKKEPPQPTIKMRPEQYSVATVLTLLRGGSITNVTGSIYEMVSGTDENFALLLRVIDGTDKKAYYVAKGTLNTIPEEVMDGQDLEGWDLEITPLLPDDGSKALRKFLNSNPLA